MMDLQLKTIDNIAIIANATGCHLVLEWRNADNYAETLHFDSTQVGLLYDMLTADRIYQNKQTKKNLQHFFEESKVGQSFGEDVKYKSVPEGNYTFRDVIIGFQGFLTGKGYDYEEVEGW